MLSSVTIRTYVLFNRFPVLIINLTIERWFGGYAVASLGKTPTLVVT